MSAADVKTAAPAGASRSTQVLTALRESMRRLKLDAYIVPTADAHQAREPRFYVLASLLLYTLRFAAT
jgi:hypothetical protein